MQKPTFKNKVFARKQAFTLIELLIVIAIIGVLFIVLVSKVDFATDKAKASGVQTDFRSFQMAFETVARENAGFNTFGWDIGDVNANGKKDVYDEGDINQNGKQDSGEIWTGRKTSSEVFLGIYTLIKPGATGYDSGAIAELESAINANLDPKLHITIKDDGEIVMANSAQDPWNTEYHGYYITNAEADGKDQGAIIMYSNGANQEFGSEHSIANGVVTVTVPGNNVYGKDDYATATIYTYKNKYGEVETLTSGFSNNQNQLNSSVANNNNANNPEVDNDVVDQFESAGSGLYSQDGSLLCSWESLVNDYGFDISQDHEREGYFDDPTTFTYIMQNHSEFDDAFALVLPDDVTYIGQYTFTEGCRIKLLKFPKNMTRINSLVCVGSEINEIVFPENLETIGGAAFWGCQINSIELPSSLKKIEAFAFFDSRIENITFNDGLKAIGNSAFEHSSLNNDIFIPASVDYVGEDAFSYTDISNFTCDPAFRGEIGRIYYCMQLKTVDIPVSRYSLNRLYLGKCPELTYINGLESQINENNIYRLGTLSRTNPNLFIESEKDNIKYLGFESYPYLLAVKCLNVTDTVVIADGCRMILATLDVVEGDIETGWNGWNRPIFDGHVNTFNELVLPEGLWYVDNGALCAHMKHMNMPHSLIAFDGFGDCQTCYQYASLEELYIPATCDIDLFSIIRFHYVNNLIVESGHPKYYTINGNVISREDKKLIYGTTPYIPSDIVAIGEYAFENATFTSINIPSNILFIEFGAFQNSKLESVILNEGLLTISREAFAGTKLTEITIPTSVLYIGDSAWNNYSVGTVYYKGTKENWDNLVKGEYVHVGNEVLEWSWTEPNNLICLNQPANQIPLSNGNVYEWIYQEGAYMGIHPKIKVIDGELHYIQEIKAFEKTDDLYLLSDWSLFGIALNDGSIMTHPEDTTYLQPLVLNGHNGFGVYYQEGDFYSIEGFYESNGETYLYVEMYVDYPYEIMSGGDASLELIPINNALVTRMGDIYLLVN